MKRSGWFAASVLLALASVPPATTLASPIGRTSQSVTGEVVQVRRSTATAAEGACTEIQVRTRQQEETWLRLGPVSDRGPDYRPGDRIRARVVSNGKTGVRAVESIRNLRTREMSRIRSADGSLVRQESGDGTGTRLREHDRTRDQDRLRDQARSRDRERPGSRGRR